MRLRLTLVQLEAFVHVAHAKSFRAAAATLNVTQPALTRSIKIVEEELGTRLFDRMPHGVDVTPDGLKLLPIAERILAELDDSFSDLALHIKGAVGRIAIAVLPSIGVTILPDLVQSFQKGGRHFQFIIQNVSEAPLLDLLESGRVDFAISLRPTNLAGMEFTLLLEDRFVLVCSRDHALAGLPEVPWSVFGQHPVVAGTRDTSVRTICDAVFSREGIAVIPACEIADWSLGGRLVARNLGISAMPITALALTDMSPLATVALKPVVSRSIGILTRSGRSLSTAARLFLSHVTKNVGTNMKDSRIT
jgi:LysR family transcriptional regulator, carnitine catabolism transcriptional activator